MSASRPLVSVITPTWRRPELLAECVANVRAQTYRPLEHVVVSDGEDADLALRLVCMREDRESCSHYVFPFNSDVVIRSVQLGRNWSTFLDNSFCAAPLTVGMLVARGDYQMWLADDERMAPDHVESLVGALEASGADFAYSRVLVYRNGQSERDGYVIGTSPPRLGEITNVLYRTELLKHGLYPFNAGMTSDWACISRWMSYGAKHAFVDRVTLTHRADH